MMIPSERSCNIEFSCKIYFIKALSLFKVINKVIVFKKKISQTPRSQGQKYWYPQKSLVTRNTHVKYQGSSTHCSKVINKVKVFKK